MGENSNQIINAVAAGVTSLLVLFSIPHVLVSGGLRNADAQTLSNGQSVAQVPPASNSPGVPAPAPATSSQQMPQPGNSTTQDPGGLTERVETKISELHEKAAYHVHSGTSVQRLCRCDAQQRAIHAGSSPATGPKHRGDGGQRAPCVPTTHCGACRSDE
jgi:hypothetical protein